jgi:hypothetical protein
MFLDGAQKQTNNSRPGSTSSELCNAGRRKPYRYDWKFRRPDQVSTP